MGWEGGPAGFPVTGDGAAKGGFFTHFQDTDSFSGKNWVGLTHSMPTYPASLTVKQLFPSDELWFTRWNEILASLARHLRSN